MTMTTRPYDPLRYLRTEEDIAEFLIASAEEAADADDNQILLNALEVAAQARNAINTTQPDTTWRENLYSALNLIDALGMKIVLQPKN